MNRKYHKEESIGIIGSADGPTSVFIAGKKTRMPFKVRVKRCIYKYKRKKAEKKIIAGAHTLEETAAYAADTYGAVEVNRKSEEFPAKFHIYEIKTDGSCLGIEMDYSKDTFGVSFSGSKKEMKILMEMVRDLYLYYGVSETDISKRTERYLFLLNVLSI